MKYIDAEKLISAIERRIEETKSMKPSFDKFWAGQISAFKGVITIIASLQQEQTEVDLKKLKNKAELIANEIMMGVQGNKYHTCIYDTASNDFNHSHLFRAALKGIEIGLNARKL